MSIIGWMFVGVIAGFIASSVAHKEGRGIIPDILLGIAGALLGGLLFKELAAESVIRLSFYSVVVAVGGDETVAEAEMLRRLDLPAGMDHADSDIGLVGGKAGEIGFRADDGEPETGHPCQP